MKTKKITSEISIEFHGGVEGVTGTCYLIRSPSSAILIDCGLFQGSSKHHKMNFDTFRFDPSALDAVFITHAHIDHVGRLPALIAKGFKGTIYSLPPTKELAEILLRDSLRFSDEKEGALFSETHIAETMKRWEVLLYYQKHTVKDFEIVLKNSGHILGSCMVEITVGGKKIVCTGDFGNVPSVLLPPPDELADDTEYLIIESTYGDRTHEHPESRALELERAIEDVVTARGVLMMPTFATERTQDVLYELNEMLRHHRVPTLPIFVDSPLAIRATEIFKKYGSYYSDKVQKVLKKDPHLFNFDKLSMTESVEESKRINDVEPPKVILAGSGMSNGGRILHHERRYLQDSRSILLLVGYQATGSLGRALLDGADTVKIFRETIPVRAAVRAISGYSAHADGPQLFAFIKKHRTNLKKVFVVQGESEAANALAQNVKDNLGISAEVPILYEKVILD